MKKQDYSFQAGVLVNHDAKLKALAKARDCTRKPGVMCISYRYMTNQIGNEPKLDH